MTLAHQAYGPLAVSPLAFGAAHIGDPAQDDEAIGRLLNQVVDAGINVFDTALSYGLSEDRIRRHLGARRKEVILSTKVGYGVAGHADWTPGCIAAGIDQALRNLGVDHLDIVHLHSCPKDVLIHSGVIEPLVNAVAAGKVRVAAYSGDNDALAWAVDSGAFQGVQASFSLVDRANYETLHRAQSRGVGVLIKRVLANAVWRYSESPSQPDHQEYWRRWQALAWPDFGLSPAEIAIRFAFYESTASACLLGTTRWQNFESLMSALANGPLPDDIARTMRDRWQTIGAAWPALI